LTLDAFDIAPLTARFLRRAQGKETYKEITLTSKSLYGFIMAGGVGSRLWPRSRKASPKQFLDLISKETMLQDAYRRLLPIIPAERILIGTGADYVATVREQLPDLPPANIIVEPSGRGTAPAIGLGALHIQRAAGTAASEAVMVVVTADHHIGDAPFFRRALLAAAETAQSGSLVTLGITPSFASTGYGYIQRGELLQTLDDIKVYKALRFTEKPDAFTAQQFLDSGAYSWNSGMFIWRVQTIRAEFARQMPELWAQMAEIEGAFGTPDEQAVLEKVWATVAKETIDYGIMEHALDVAVIPADIDWNDIGSWQTLMELLQSGAAVTDAGNVISGEHVIIDTHNTLVHSPKKLVATIGLQDLVIVETEDALLVCPQDRCQDVRKVVDLLRARGREDLL
jgi:mannose-1-phosphate guanylyltransferase